MTVNVCILVSEGIILTADSRQVLESPSGQMRVGSDNAHKIFRQGSHLGVIVCGQGCFYSNGSESPRNIGANLRSIAALIPENCPVKEAASIIHHKLAQDLERHRNVTGAGRGGLAFYIAGYDPGGDVGELYRCQVPGEIVLERKTTDAGLVWNGQREIINRLILGYDPRLPEFLPLSAGETALHKLQLYLDFQTMPLQDAVDLAVFLVQATIKLQRLSDGIVGAPGQFPTCGGVIDVAVLTPVEGFRWLQHKQLQVCASEERRCL